MKLVKFKVEFRSLSPVLFCRPHQIEAEKGETPADKEERTWKERAHYIGDEVIIPGRMFQMGLESAAKLTGERIQGKKRGRGISHYLAGVRIAGQIKTGVKKSKLKGQSAFVSSTGKPDGPRVMRTYPQIDKWKGILEVSYTDLGFLTSQKVIEYLNIVGSEIGIGHWRPGAPSRGSYGLFEVRKVGAK